MSFDLSLGKVSLVMAINRVLVEVLIGIDAIAAKTDCFKVQGEVHRGTVLKCVGDWNHHGARLGGGRVGLSAHAAQSGCVHLYCVVADVG